MKLVEYHCPLGYAPPFKVGAMDSREKTWGIIDAEEALVFTTEWELREAAQWVCNALNAAVDCDTGAVEISSSRWVDFVFDDSCMITGSNTNLLFIETEDAETGKGVSVGRQFRRDDGYWVLRVNVDITTPPAEQRDVCRWTWNALRYDSHYSPECDPGMEHTGRNKFCPHCGLRIEVAKEADDETN